MFSTSRTSLSEIIQALQVSVCVGLLCQVCPPGKNSFFSLPGWPSTWCVVDSSYPLCQPSTLPGWTPLTSPDASSPFPGKPQHSCLHWDKPSWIQVTRTTPHISEVFTHICITLTYFLFHQKHLSARLPCQHHEALWQSLLCSLTATIDPISDWTNSKEQPPSKDVKAY